MPILPFSKEMGEFWESKCIKFVNEGKGKRGRDEMVRCVHDGSKEGNKSYAKVYLLNVKRNNPLEPNRAKIRFWYHTITIRDNEGKKEVERCEVRASEEAIRMLGETFEVGGQLAKLGMKFMDANGNIDIDALKEILETAVKLVEGTENPEVKIILDKE